MQPPKRKHLLLLAIEFPVRLIMWTWNLLTLVFGMPLYLYFVLVQDFVTARKFKESVMFIALFSPLRVLALLLVPAIPLLQGLLFSSLTKLLVLNIAAAPSKTTVWTSTLAVGLLMAGLSWGGMKRLGKRSGRIQPFEIYKPAINDSFYYIIAALFTILDCAMLIRIYKLRKYHQEGPAIDLKHYAVFSVIECFKSVGSIISLVFLAIIILLPWRAYETFQLMKAEKTYKQRRLIMIVQVLNTLLDFLLSPLALVVFATFYRLPGLLRKLDFRRGTAWRGHLLGAAWGLACDMPYVIMGIMLLGTIYMPFIFFGRVKYERHGHHDTFGVGDFKRILRECFFEFWLFHIPLLMLELVLCLFFLVDPWLLFDIYPHWNHLLSGGILISEIAAHLVANGVYLVCDLLHTPMFFLSLLQIWRLPTVLRVYKSNLFTSRHHWAIRRCFFSMLCQILIVAFTLLLSCVAPWRLGMLVSCLVASRTSSNAADEANLTPEALLVRRMPYYEAQFTALLFVTEQVLKDWLVIPIFALLLLSVVHIPLAVRLLFLKFTSVDPAKRRELEGERRDLFVHLLWKVIVEIYTLIVLVLFIALFWRIPFLVRAAQKRTQRLVQHKGHQEMREIYEYIMQENIVELMAYCVTDALAQAIMDLPFVPFFFLSLATSPWRLFPWLAGALAGADISYDDYIKLQSVKRWELFDAFVLGLLDDLMAIWLVLSVVYLWRIPLCIRMIRTPFSDTTATDKTTYTYRCYMTRTFLPALACTLWVWICDLPFVPVYAVCMAATPWRFYFWNSIKADDKAKTFTEYTTKQEGTRLDLLSALWEGLLDIVCSVVGAAMAVTLWKVPMLLKILRINGHMSEAQTETLSELDRIKLLRVKGKTFMSIHQCVLFCFFSWALDLPTVPLGLAVSIVFPWRASTVFSLVIKPDDRLPTKFSLEKLLLNRRLYTIFIILAMFISDLTCIFCGALLFLSVWHVGELYTILVKKKPGKKREDGVSVSDYFEMNRQIYKKFMFLLVDVLQVAQIVFIICTGVQAPSLVRRLKTLWRNERAEQRVLRIRKFPEGDKKPQKQFVSMPYNVMTTILSFCDVPDVLRAEGTCRKVCEAASAPRVWTKLHETKYAKFAPIPSGTEDPDYRRFCVAGYKEMRERAKRSEEPIISEEERDRIIGARVIICEESVYAILRLPHILCLPVKALAFILHPTRTPLLALIQKLSENPEFHTYSLYDVINGPHPDYFLERDAGELRDFWRVQDTLLGTVAIYYIAFSLTVATLAAKINFSIMKATTEWITHPIIVNSYWNQIAYGGQLPAMTRPFFNGTMQVLTFPVVLALCFGPFILPFWLCYHYLGYDVLASIGGPYLLNVFPFGTGIQIIITTCDLLRSATHYNPIKAIFEGASVVGRTGRDGITRVVSFLFRLIKGAFVTFIRPVLTKLLEAIGDMIVGTSRLVKNAFRLAFKLYFLPVVLCGKALRFLGIVGEFITLMVGLAWMLWPMAAPWYLANRVLYIPCIIATCVFIVTGWFALKNI